MLGSCSTSSSSMSFESGDPLRDACRLILVERLEALVPTLLCPRDDDACEPSSFDSVEIVRERRRVVGGDGREYEVDGTRGEERPD